MCEKMKTNRHNQSERSLIPTSWEQQSTSTDASEALAKVPTTFSYKNIHLPLIKTTKIQLQIEIMT